jgi:ATP-dependent DNA helicase RecG
MKYEESYTLELKERINSDFKKEIVAFANADGGEIYIGVSQNGSIVGVENAETEMERIGNVIRDGINRIWNNFWNALLLLPIKF